MTAKKSKASAPVQHYLITNRAIEANGTIFNDGTEEASDNLRFGKVSFTAGKSGYKLKDFDISLEPELSIEEYKEVYAKGEDYVEPRLGSYKVFDQLHKICKQNEDEDTGNILVFVHGYNCNFERSLALLARLHDKYVVNQNSPIEHLILFTWPSKNNFLTYRNDARDAVKSGYALARSFEKLKAYLRNLALNHPDDPKSGFCNKKIHLMCHSMGCRVLQSMIEELISRNTALNSVFAEVVMVGADVDYDAMESPKPLYRLIDLCQRVHIYYHNNDRALGISEISKNAFNRLGRWGARNSVVLTDDVLQVDISEIHDEARIYDDLVNHFHYLSSQMVIEDILLVLAGENSEILDTFNLAGI